MMRSFFERLAYSTERFMRGRNGMDNLARGLYWIGIILLILSLFFGTGLLNLLATAAFAAAIFRMLSTNLEARQRENVWYLNKTEALRGKAGHRGGNVLEDARKKAAQQKMRFDERKEYRFFKCKCGATLRVKRGQGTKELVCPICKEHMTRNTD